MNVEMTKRILKNLPVGQSVMLVAKHGVGKSSVIRQVAEEQGINFIDVRLSQCEVGDIKGLPVLDKENGMTRYLKPRWWPRDPNSSGIILFDEINRAAKDVLQTVFEVCLDRRLDGEMLPDGWRVCAAINGSEEYDVIELDPALYDRWFVIHFDPSVEEWMKYARSVGIHDSILDFIHRNPQLLDPPEKEMEAGVTYPSRRSWEKFDEACKALGIFDGLKDEGLLTMMCKSWCGSTAAIMFPKFFYNEFANISPKDVIERYGKVRDSFLKILSDIEVVTSTSNAVLAEIEKRASLSKKEAKNIRDMMMDVPDEMFMAIWTKLMKLKQLKPHLQEWADKDTELTAKLTQIISIN
jgi:hypothetical protein